MMIRKIICFLTLLAFFCLLLAGCGESAVKNATVNDRGEIIIEYEDGSTRQMGTVPVSPASTQESPQGQAGVDATEAYVDKNGHIIVGFSDGTKKDFGALETGPASAALSVNEVKVNDEKHAIAYMSDGSTVDLGYVGVEVTVEVEVVPPLYTVTFTDLDGKILSVQKVYRGQPAEAPAAPSVPDATFDKWDADYLNIQSDITIKPVYIGADTYTVIFLDDKGNTLSTQTVISGHAAKAPATPTYDDLVFDKWDKSFGSVKSDLTVTAVYRTRKTFTVTFKDYSGASLGSVQVKEGASATAPATPTREGYSFSGWSSALTNITADKTVTAKYTQNSGTNIFDISYEIKSGGNVTVTFKMNGSVKFCGMEGSVKLPSGLTYVSLTEGDGATANYKDGTVYFMFASNSGKNVTSATTIMTVNLKVASGTVSATLDVAITDIYDQDYNTVSKKIIGTGLKF